MWVYKHKLFEGTLRDILESMSKDEELSNEFCEVLETSHTHQAGAVTSFGHLLVLYRIRKRVDATISK